MNLPGFPIRKSTDQHLFAIPRGLSQLITPFIACPCQGIHHEPYLCLTPTILHMPPQNTLGAGKTAVLVYNVHRLTCARMLGMQHDVSLVRKDEHTRLCVLHRAVRMTFTIMSKNKAPVQYSGAQWS